MDLRVNNAITKHDLKEKILSGNRIDFDEALSLYDMDFFELGDLADIKRKERQGKKTYFNINRQYQPYKCVCGCV